MKNKIFCKHGNEFILESFLKELSIVRINCCDVTLELKQDTSFINYYYKDKYFIYSALFNNNTLLRLKYSQSIYNNILNKRYPNLIIFDENDYENEFYFDDNELNTAQKQFDALYKVYENLIFL